MSNTDKSKIHANLSGTQNSDHLLAVTKVTDRNNYYLLYCFFFQADSDDEDTELEHASKQQSNSGYWL